MSDIEIQSELSQRLRQYHVGQRVMAHPATDTWAKGDRYGTVACVGTKYVSVKLDRSQRVLRFHPDNLISQE